MSAEGLRRDPTDAAGLVSLARVKMMQGKFEAARQLAQRSRDLGFEPAGALVCVALYSLGEAREARECWVRLPAIMRDRYNPPSP